jgi:hypothetical protein
MACRGLLGCLSRLGGMERFGLLRNIVSGLCLCLCLLCKGLEIRLLTGWRRAIVPMLGHWTAAIASSSSGCLVLVKNL